MVKAILFDIDNTLMDYIEMKSRCCEEAIDAMINAGWKVSRKKALVELYKLYEIHSMDYEKIFQKLLKKISGKIDYHILAHGVIQYRKFREGYLIPYPNTVKTLLELRKNYKLAVVTDAPSFMAWMRLVSMKLGDFFDVVITKGDVKKQKDTLTPFRSALKKLEMKAEDVIMVGDRVSRDVKTPQKIGIKTVYARYGDKKPLPKGTSGAEFELQDISELTKVLKIIEKRK